MSQTLFSELELITPVRRAIEEMGFETATEIQAKTIPLIQEGRDVIGLSQTGTGKTIAFGIPAIESVDVSPELKNKAQVLILCPTRELAMQACEEIKKLAAYKHGVKTADIYGGAPMDRQIMRLRSANIVVGTPGRVMDHMRRRTLKLDNISMVVLDEADEMLNMGFREDIETILKDTPQERQTVLFSATMPPAILALTKTYQQDPELIQVNRSQPTVEAIEQTFYDVPMGRKLDALQLLLRYHAPKLALVFCNTKRGVDELSAYLTDNGFFAEGLHGDMKQSQRTRVMDAFKHGNTAILIATDVAARGIDVNDIDYVYNFDIPQNPEYYVHRIGRTGRAGKSGKAVTICSGRRQVQSLLALGRMVKCKPQEEELPSLDELTTHLQSQRLAELESAVKEAGELAYYPMVETLTQRGYDPKILAAVLMQMQFGSEEIKLKEIKNERPAKSRQGGGYQKIVISVGRQQRIAPNHIVGAITERTQLSGRDIGKIEIFDDKTLVSIPAQEAEDAVDAMRSFKIAGCPAAASLYAVPRSSHPGKSQRDYRHLPPKKRGRPDKRHTQRSPRG